MCKIDDTHHPKNYRQPDTDEHQAGDGVQDLDRNNE